MSLQYQIKRTGHESVLAGLTGTAWFYYQGPHPVGNEHGAIPWVPATFDMPISVKSLYCSVQREKLLDHIAIALIAPSQSKARLHPLSPEFGRDGIGFATCSFGILPKNSQFGP